MPANGSTLEAGHLLSLISTTPWTGRAKGSTMRGSTHLEISVEDLRRLLQHAILGVGLVHHSREHVLQQVGYLQGTRHPRRRIHGHPAVSNEKEFLPLGTSSGKVHGNDKHSRCAPRYAIPHQRVAGSPQENERGEGITRHFGWNTPRAGALQQAPNKPMRRIRSSRHVSERPHG